MRTLDWYYDFISPYSYLQCATFPALPADVQVHLKPVLFGALLDQAGTLGPAEIPGKREHTYRQTLWLAQRHGVPMRLPPRHPFNPLSVLRLAIALDAPLGTVRRIFGFFCVRFESCLDRRVSDAGPGVGDAEGVREHGELCRLGWIAAFRPDEVENPAHGPKRRIEGDG